MKGDTLDFFRRLRQPLPVGDGHWMSPKEEGGVVIEPRSPFPICH